MFHESCRRHGDRRELKLSAGAAADARWRHWDRSHPNHRVSLKPKQSARSECKQAKMKAERETSRMQSHLRRRRAAAHARTPHTARVSQPKESYFLKPLQMKFHTNSREKTEPKLPPWVCAMKSCVNGWRGLQFVCFVSRTLKPVRLTAVDVQAVEAVPPSEPSQRVWSSSATPRISVHLSSLRV